MALWFGARAATLVLEHAVTLFQYAAHAASKDRQFRMWLLANGATKMATGVNTCKHTRMWGFARTVRVEIPSIQSLMFHLDVADAREVPVVLSSSADEIERVKSWGETYTPRLVAVTPSRAHP